MPDMTRNYHDGNPFSDAAFKAVPEKIRGQRRREVYGVIQAARSDGATSDEVEVVLNRPHQSVSARISELKRDGWIRGSGRSRRTRCGTLAEVYVADGILFTGPFDR